MKLISALLLLLATFFVGAYAAGNPLSVVCDFAGSEFQDRHQAVISTISKNWDQGWGWTQETALVMPVPTDTGVMLVEVQRYTWYHFVEWSAKLCSFIETQAWPKYIIDPVTYAASFLGWGIQQIRLYELPPAYRQSKSIPPVPERALTEYDIEWMTPYLADSAIAMGADVLNVGLGSTTTNYNMRRASDGKLMIHTALNSYVPHEHRIYTLHVPIEAIPDVPHSTFEVLAHITSTAGPVPQVITDALAWFESVKDLENPPLTPDPQDFTGQLPPVFIYQPAAAKMKDGAYPAGVPENTHGIAFPILDSASYNRAVDIISAALQE